MKVCKINTGIFRRQWILVVSNETWKNILDFIFSLFLSNQTSKTIYTTFHILKHFPEKLLVVGKKTTKSYNNICQLPFLFASSFWVKGSHTTYETDSLKSGLSLNKTENIFLFFLLISPPHKIFYKRNDRPYGAKVILNQQTRWMKFCFHFFFFFFVRIFAKISKRVEELVWKLLLLRGFSGVCVVQRYNSFDDTHEFDSHIEHIV